MGGTPAQQRLVSIDALRGLVMVLMALDHARDFFGFTGYDPTDLKAHDSAGLFLTRWVTHFCAPVFVFLAGVSALLWGRRHAGERSAWAGRRRVAGYLLTRGAWLILLELTVVRWAWFATTITDWGYSWFFVQVIWALGWSMIALSALVFLPTPVIGVIGVAMIAGHNLLDGVDPAGLGAFSGVFKVLHVPAMVEWPAGGRMLVRYPLVPWIGVMGAGYWFGTVMLLEGRARRRVCVLLGLGLIGLFMVLRGINGYGDPSAWSGQRTGLFTVFSFLNCTKYPPSLDFLLMTLGPGLVVLGLMDWCSGAPSSNGGAPPAAPTRRRVGGTILEVLAVYGRVPLFFYVAHLVVLQFTAFAYAYARYGGQIFRWGPGDIPDDFYQGLGPVYFAWACVVMLLYPACQWLGGVKRRKRSWWTGYV